MHNSITHERQPLEDGSLDPPIDFAPRTRLEPAKMSTGGRQSHNDHAVASSIHWNMLHDWIIGRIYRQVGYTYFGYDVVA